MAPNAGLVHLKEYDIEDSNVELIGSDIDHRVKYNSAATEPAWNDGQVGRSPGLYVWRIEDFQVVPWPREKHGRFHSGDSYIVLHSVKIGSSSSTQEKLVHDIFFWLGAYTTQDEAGTAAYKTVELDEFLRGSATQHRELQRSPSDDFLSLFPRISILSGGVSTGFRHVEEEEDGSKKAETRTLLRVFSNPSGGADGVIVHEVEPTWRSLDDGDVFVLDAGDKIWVWQGKDSSPFEKAKASQVAHDMTQAKHADVEVVSQTESRAGRVLSLLGSDDEVPKAGLTNSRPVTTSRSPSSAAGLDKKLFRLSDASGALSFEAVKQGPSLSADDLDGNDVFLVDDAGSAIWVWEGQRASRAERASWLNVARSYIQHIQSSQPGAYTIPLAKVVQGNESRSFLRALEGH
ncbi:unnamed protein product [Clonostachys rosea f. rosea IK726]|jgi:gelsolin|uniref:Uncharacterized protein n=1 Tax=Clonostachys rosea f. rosea IK726 TaxID=1349383 RepID=A0ACA9UV36_BIOOC|nr:unnamed protein product [Clonostachys rosea f. rosea IK726]